MTLHEDRPCPRCGKLFVCKSGTGRHCQCENIELGHLLLEHLADLYEDCLCIDCLAKLKERGLDFR